MKRFSIVVISLIAFVLLLVGADLVAVRMAQSRAEATVADSGVTGVGVEVKIHGFPFLTQLAQGELDHVTGSAQTASVGGLEATDLTVEAWGMSTDSPYTVQHGEVSGVVSTSVIEAAVASQTGMSLTVESQGKVISLSGDVFGTALSLDVVPEIQADTVVKIVVNQIRIDGKPVAVDQLPDFARAGLENITIPLSLPEGVKLTEVKVVSHGLYVAADGYAISLVDLMNS